MNMDRSAGVLAIASMLWLVGCTEEAQISFETNSLEEHADHIDPLLRGPMGLTWLDSQEVIVRKGLVGTFKEFHEQSELELGWEDELATSNEHSCFSEYRCVSINEALVGNLFTSATLRFEDNQLVGFTQVLINPIEGSSEEAAKERTEELYGILANIVTKDYEVTSENFIVSEFGSGPVEVLLFRATLPGDDGMTFTQHVTLEYKFNTAEYYAFPLQENRD